MTTIKNYKNEFLQYHATISNFILGCLYWAEITLLLIDTCNGLILLEIITTFDHYTCDLVVSLQFKRIVLLSQFTLQGYVGWLLSQSKS